MLIVKCNKKISLFVQLFVCCHLFCLCADINYFNVPTVVFREINKRLYTPCNAAS